MTTTDDGKAFLQLCLAKRLLDKDQARDVWAHAKQTGATPQQVLIERGLMAAPTIEALEKELKRAQEPRTIGGFRLIRILGQGGMARVFLAEQLSLGREVALKLMSPQIAGDADAAERFLREARTAATVNHPNVVSIIDVGREDGQLYMAMELVTGGDAGQLAKRAGGALAEPRALGLLIDCAKGLQALHDARLVHRDLKPSNIFITGDGSAKLGDLGLARSEDGADRMTMTGHLVGTPAFMSPEQANGGKDVDIRSDIYALGATLFALVTGHQPFEGNGPIAVAAKVLTAPVPDPRTFTPHLSATTTDVIARAMAKDPVHRFRTPNELREALEEALAETPPQSATSQHRRNRTSTTAFLPTPDLLNNTSSPGLPGRRVTTRTVRRKRQTPDPRLLIIGAAILAAIALGLIWLSFSSKPTSKPITTASITPPPAQGPSSPAMPEPSEPASAKGAPASPPPGDPAPRAAWAQAQGRDRFGSWALLRIKNAEQCLRWIPPGHCRVGVPATLPGYQAQEEETEIDFTIGVWLADSECTQAFYQTVTGTNPSASTGDQLPVTNVTIGEAIAFTHSLSRLLNSAKTRLPSRAEWERACRAGAATIYSTGDDPASLAGYANLFDTERAKATGTKAAFTFSDGFADLAPVRHFKPNPWGLYDMHGNVFEYCLGAFGTSSVRDSMIADEAGQSGFIKGGSFDEDTVKARCGALPYIGINARNPDIGLRFLIESH